MSELFPLPDSESLVISAHFSSGFLVSIRREYGDKVSWKKYELKKFQPCDECQWVKHEHAGTAPQYRAVRVRRTLVRDNKMTFNLDLCSAHAAIWKERDGLT